MREPIKDIECRVARLLQDNGRVYGCQLKLYRNGVELPTARKINIDFIIVNNAETVYYVTKYTKINGKLYDVRIEDESGLCHYDGWMKRQRQTYYAKKHGLPLPQDTIEIERQTELEKENEKKHAEELAEKEKQAKELQQKTLEHIRARHIRERLESTYFKNRPDHVEHIKWLYNVASLDELTDENWQQIWNEYQSTRC